MLTKPAVLLRLEGATIFACAIYFYRSTGVGWLIFVALFLWPDFSMLGYLGGVRLGSRLYNLVHIEAMPLLLAAVSVSSHRPFALAFALIWLAHIGGDRTLGFGLKYPTFFQDTHLQRVAAQTPG